MSDSKKWSRVDLEVEKLKVQSDIEAEGELPHDCTYLKKGLDNPFEDGSCKYIYNSNDELRNQILANWDIDTGNDCFDFIATLAELEGDEEKLELFDKYMDEQAYDEQLFTAIATTLKDDNLKQKCIQKLDEIFEQAHGYTDDAFEMAEEAKEYGYTDYTKEHCGKILRDRYVSWIASTFSNPELMIQYYEGFDDKYAKKDLLYAILQHELYNRELSTEELQEVASRMKEEVNRAETLNAQTRAGIEEEILASLKNLTKAKQEYARLTKSNDIDIANEFDLD